MGPVGVRLKGQQELDLCPVFFCLANTRFRGTAICEAKRKTSCALKALILRMAGGQLGTEEGDRVLAQGQAH